MRRIAHISCVALLLATVAVEAQRGGGSTPPAEIGPFGALRWRSIGPPRGGRSLGVAGSVARPFEYYMGATGGDLWKTTDGGVTWRAVTDGQIHSSSVGGVAVAPSNPDVVWIAYAGCKSAVFKSTNATQVSPTFTEVTTLYSFPSASNYNSRASITGIPATGQILPRPRIAVPSVTIATEYGILV